MALPLMLDAGALAGFGGDDKDKRPKISVKANPAMGISPARVVVSADLNGGANDYEEYYCAGGRVGMGRRYAVEQCRPIATRTKPARARSSAGSPPITSTAWPAITAIQFRLKKKDKPIAAASTSVKIRPGLGDPGGDR